MEILHVSAITEESMPGNCLHYLDLIDTQLSLRLKIMNSDGSDLAPDALVVVINYPLNTIFAQCEVTLGDRLISQGQFNSSLSSLCRKRRRTSQTEGALTQPSASSRAVPRTLQQRQVKA